MNARQKHFYIERVNLYKPTAFTVGANKRATDIQWPHEDTPTYSFVPTKFFSTPFSAVVNSPIGRDNENTVLVNDRYHFPADYVRPGATKAWDLGLPDDDWVIELVYPANHPQINEFWTIEGGCRVRTRSNVAEVMAFSGLKPR